MNDPNITMEEYIKLVEEKARRHGKVYNWETATYGKNWYDKDVRDLKAIETEFPAIVFDDAFLIYFDDLDFLKDFENEFLAILYNDALTSKSHSLTEPIEVPQYVDEFDETSLSECNDEEQNVIYFNDLFPFNVLNPDDLSNKDNDDDKINIKQSSGAYMYQYDVSWGTNTMY
nr:hypothetical protein [Tanacetum cinerariifolium]